MKFAKELEHELVPEWRAKYLDYKVGKKKIKDVSSALRRAQINTPRTPYRSARSRDLEDLAYGATLARTASNGNSTKRQGPLYSTTPATTATPEDGLLPRSRSRGQRVGYLDSSLRRPSDLERQPLHDDFDELGQDSHAPRLTRYGSIVCSPPDSTSRSLRGRGPPSLDLPGPALHASDRPAYTMGLEPGIKDDEAEQARQCDTKNEPGSVKPKQSLHRKSLSLRYRMFKPKRVNSMPPHPENEPHSKPMLRRLMSLGHSGKNMLPQGTFAMESYKDVDLRQAEFFDFLDLELDKVESFYQAKEDDATQRLEVLREQLHIMRDRRVDELVKARKESLRRKQGIDDSEPFLGGNGQSLLNPQAWLHKADEALKIAKFGKTGKRTKAMETLGTPHALEAQNQDPAHDIRDYVRRKQHNQIAYRTAKRKLKDAMQEYYRGLELLKSYALLNRKAFRKINKKYDKAVTARPPLRYMAEKVNDAWFVKSDVLDSHIKTVEDLYARYFEGGNHKVAAGKLRARTMHTMDCTGSVFRTGILLAAALVFGVQGLVAGGELLFHPDPVMVSNTSYMLQIYAGYFLMLMLMLFFVIDCRAWSRAKVNYTFVFEYDTRHHLDWRQLAELPCLFLFLLGFFLWINFARYGSHEMYIYFPVILIGVTFIILFNPLPTMYHHTRWWFLIACWRLFFSGLYPVEFRDFFLGDMFCSQTYALGNTELFFCLYAHTFNNNFLNPGQCNSTSSRLIGFFSTLPGIWRALQCARRFRDTKNWFPHLANGGKYLCTILYYMSLSLWRIDNIWQLRAFFIACATMNAVYCSVWDVAMDWSLMDPYAEHRFLRDHLAFKRVWVYYVAIVLDPILRFNWIFYAIYGHSSQHSSLVSFFVAFSEVCRRGMWTIFRVENEHCTNVERFRASRDIPLPYKLKKTREQRVQEGQTLQSVQEDDDPGDTEREQCEEERRRQGISVSPAMAQASGVDIHRIATTESEVSSRRRRRGVVAPSPLVRGLTRVGSIIHFAHAQDFERKRRSPAVAADDRASSDEEEDDDHTAESEEEANAESMQEEQLREVANDIVAEQESERVQNMDGPSAPVFSFQPHRHGESEEDQDVQSPSGTVRRNKKVGQS